MNVDSVTLAAVVNGIVQGPATLFSGIALDSRAAREGDLFVAIPGPNHDGHDFLPQALEKAAGALVSRSVSGEFPAGRTFVRVRNTVQALQELAKYVRNTLSPKVVAIVGSVGKTTTKELTAALLSARWVTGKTSGNLNNTIGLPAEVARLPEGTEAAVLEMGMSYPGEVKLLSDLMRPDVAVVTAIAPEHLMNFQGLEGVLEANAEVLSGLRTGGTLVVNGDDPNAMKIAARHHGPVRRFGLAGEELAGTAVDLEPEGSGMRFTLVVDGVVAEVRLPLPGAHNVTNFLAAAAAASALEVTPSEMARAVAEFSGAPHRSIVRTLQDGTLLYDDTYNSSPVALAAAYRAFEAIAGTRRRIAVVGDMRELGRFSEEYHTAAGRDLAGRADVIVCVGSEVGPLAAAAQKGTREVLRAGNVAGAIPLVRERLRAGDALFVKGSRGVGLDRLVAAVAGEGEERP